VLAGRDGRPGRRGGAARCRAPAPALPGGASVLIALATALTGRPEQTPRCDPLDTAPYRAKDLFHALIVCRKGPNGKQPHCLGRRPEVRGGAIGLRLAPGTVEKEHG
jgi:hypothetical protein